MCACGGPSFERRACVDSAPVNALACGRACARSSAAARVRACVRLRASLRACCLLYTSDAADDTPC
eukprot:1786817-Pleurochrysis_carterae.AAC.3